MKIENPSASLSNEDELNIYRECFRAIPFPAMLFDSKGRLVDISSPLKTLADRLGIEFTQGITYEAGMDELRKAYSDTASADTLDQWHVDEMRARQRALESGEPVEFERFDGGWRLINVIRTKSGYTLDIRTDITEQKNRQIELAEAEARANAADRAKSQFLANMSHEIRTPMNGVMGMAELLASSELTPKQRSFADIIVKSCDALLTIINDILDFSKIEAGQMKLHPAPFDLVNAVEDVALLVSANAAKKNLEVAVRFDPELPSTLVGDSGRLRQVITNLLSNAIKFTQAGHVLVDVSGGVSGEPDAQTAHLKFSVEDTGVGIPEEKLPWIFDKFTQVDSSATRVHEGTGLGLSICRALIELMSGEIGVQSKPGEGSVFWFEIDLPVHLQVKPQLARSLDVFEARVLVVDDNDVNRSILAEHMLFWGIDHKVASNGKEGIANLRDAASENARFDAVILDYHMPNMTGAETAKLIRADAAIRDTPILMLTSVDQTDIADELESLTVEAHLAKPVKAALLIETLTKVIQGKRKRNVNPNTVKEVHTPTVLAKQKPLDRERPALEESGQEPGEIIDILIAEDNEVNQLVYRHMLNNTDYKFEIVSDGRQSIDLFTKRRPKVIIMDISMPQMDGLEATKRIRERETNKDIARTPIIGITAHALSSDMERCLDAGMDDYLAKPITPQRLLEKIEKWMNNPSSK